MDDGELKYPMWQVPLQDVILEFDSEKFPEEIQEVESLIFERLQQLRQKPDATRELVAINDALTILKKIKSDRLRYAERDTATR